ncbi:MAG: chemotaxis response regulator protein-glutamate methylesterase, partial [Thermodesulfobacteriota bacterium]|nr:chemotaxis response regulator protein-glutamate methylesterase [Thermodesulfobacteriota bacterium]
AVYRKIVSEILAELPDVEVVGVAHNGRIAMSKIASLKPDLLTLDIEMPEMNGLEVLANINASNQDVGAIMLSTLTHEGGEMTMKALELGAFDFIPKAESGSMEESKEAIKAAIGPIVKAFIRQKEIRNILKGKSVASRSPSEKKDPPVSTVVARRTDAFGSRKRMKSEIVVIGISTGGPNALARMLPKLKRNLDVPFLIVQHMPPVFTDSLAHNLDSKCDLAVREAVDGEKVQPNTALIAPGGKQMKVAVGADGKTRIIRITDDSPENGCRPSADYLFRSIAHHYVGRATGVIMTGMGSDGTLGLKLMKRNGAAIIAQDEETCIVYGMPKASVEAGIVDVVAPLDRIADEIRRTVK